MHIGWLRCSVIAFRRRLFKDCKRVHDPVRGGSGRKIWMQKIVPLKIYCINTSNILLLLTPTNELLLHLFHKSNTIYYNMLLVKPAATNRSYTDQ